DVSDSMRTKLDRARAALKAFIETSHHSDDFFLVSFNHHPRLLGGPIKGETVLRLLSEVYAYGSTALYDAAYIGAEEVKQGIHNKRALLIISDGEDNSSIYTYTELRRLLQESDIQVYCIGLVEPDWGFASSTNDRGRMLLTQIAKITGGSAFFPRLNRELDDAVERIAVALRRQYSIGYIPSNFSRDGKWRKIKV